MYDASSGQEQANPAQEPSSSTDAKDDKKIKDADFEVVDED